MLVYFIISIWINQSGRFISTLLNVWYIPSDIKRLNKKKNDNSEKVKEYKNIIISWIYIQNINKIYYSLLSLLN